MCQVFTYIMNLTRSLKPYKHFVHVLLPVCLIFLIQFSQKRIIVKELIRFQPDMKHILVWTNIQALKGDGQTYFTNRKCEYTNCYLTRNRNLFGDIRYFDLILFNLQDVSVDSEHLPHVRGQNQRYIFVANNSADNYPICDSKYDNFFNWTWTYRYDSTIPYRFITVHNTQYEELGSHFHWNTNMKPIDEKIKSKFSTKSKAAVIFLDKCKSRNKREILVKDLQKELGRFNLTVDIFGECGPRQCRRRTMQPCYWRVKKMYYFYLAFEDSMSADYITQAVLNAYDNYAVPIVYGGVHYDKYLPPGSYLNAVNASAATLAQTMHDIIANREKYYNYFRWRNHYIISKSTPLDGCDLCQLMNNPVTLKQTSSYENFRKWWNPNYIQRCKSN
ncbi:unnamed protein product [Pieris macdunnoughi]|uniref:Fucosyltransferase n=2 Tax=Pieris macdunnoughi TaxID=345717 RepID=A0A821M6Q1_9NEOP|nr:unnamed protein product [Pieris macdunnoughi]